MTPEERTKFVQQLKEIEVERPKVWKAALRLVYRETKDEDEAFEIARKYFGDVLKTISPENYALWSDRHLTLDRLVRVDPPTEKSRKGIRPPRTLSLHLELGLVYGGRYFGWS